MLEYFYRAHDQELLCGREEQLAGLANALLAPRHVDCTFPGCAGSAATGRADPGDGRGVSHDERRFLS
jgi:hypothetical protein